MDNRTRHKTIEDFLERRDIQKARNATNDLLRKNPDDIVGLYYLALCDYYAGHLDGAEQTAKKLLRRSDRFAPAHHLLGLISEEQGDEDAAYHAFQAAMEGGYQPAAAKLDQHRGSTHRIEHHQERQTPTFADFVRDVEAERGLNEAPYEREEEVPWESIFEIGLFLLYVIPGAFLGAVISGFIGSSGWIGSLIGVIIGIIVWFQREM